MIGEDTLLTTRDGLVALKDLNIGDEVLTQYGVFLPIFSMGEWKDAAYVVEIDDEEIYCRGSLMFMDRKNAPVSVFDIIDNSLKNMKCASILFEDTVKTELKNGEYPHKCGVDIPQEVPEYVMRGDLNTRLAFFAGMVDSVNGSIASANYYVISSAYDCVLRDLKILIRSFGWTFKMRDRHTICAYPVGLIDMSFVKCQDEYKMRVGVSGVSHAMSIDGVYRVRGEKVRCREVLVGSREHNLPYLVGKSRIPVM